VKNLAKLVLSFTVSFVIILVIGEAVGIFHAGVGKALLFPPHGAAFGLAAAALPAAFYFSILLGLSYASTRRISYPAVFIVLFIFSVGFLTAAFTGLSRLDSVKGDLIAPPAVNARPGILLTVAAGQPPTQAVLLGGEPSGPRVLSLPNQPLYYEAASATYGMRQVRLPFRDESGPLLNGIGADFNRSAAFLGAWYDSGIVPFCIYSGSLALLLISIGCLVNISFWPLANLLFGALAFRGALALEAFLNSDEIHGLLASFAGGIIPESLISPVIFTVLALLILLYSFLVFLARGRRGE